MKLKFNRVWSGAAALAVAASTAPFFSAPAAHAAGTLAGTGTVRNAANTADLTSGTSATQFTVALPTGASCPGDSTNSGYSVNSYMVPASVDPSTLTFDSSGPIPNDVGAAFRQPLYIASSTGAYASAQTADQTAPNGPGQIINIPIFTYGVFGPGDIPAGTYNIGIACTKGAAGPTQMSSYWNFQETFTTNAASGGPAQVNWAVGGPSAVPGAPTGVVVTPGNGSLSVAFNPVTASPAVSGYTATATPTTGSPITATGAGSPITVPGLTNGTAYTVTVHATNSVGNSAESTPGVTGTPVAPPASFGPLSQRVTVSVPAGTIVFTQVCGKHNALPTDTFAPGAVASTAAQESGPKTTDGGSVTDPNYPANYPAPPTYPTFCGLAMGAASFVNGQPYSAATGILNQVTVTDTRQADTGWQVSGLMQNLVGSPSGTIQGNQLGWRPLPTPTPAYAGYSQVVNFENADPGASGATHGLGTPVKLGFAAAGAGLGSAQLDARVKMLIPLSAPPGTYSGLLNLTLIPS